ncbi:ABC transporter ATP-binding protein [Thalassobacillus pellis]|uniref:ABC transporter ATP-binding protein n=1 Tax=Thalassobacillus pellis TaxID=748008 RepID=UPI00196015FD|nr:ABC transporter ATP-binding protein [Thalassobacillus pellis]MBM7553888.1 oligopeptide/dipeptide ABC transporter ATP-binding protein [Thalassobacillus pellis]
MLDVKNLKVMFHSKQAEMVAVDEVSFSVRAGETVALIGESGSGKSVTSQAIMGLLPDNGRIAGGEVSFLNQNLVKLSEKEMRRIRGMKISMIFQDATVSLNPTMKIGKQIVEGLHYHQLFPKKESKGEALRLLSIVGFENPSDIYHQYPGELSGGMKQRALIAMAISCEPQLVIADEPTTALDVTIQKQILDLMDDYKRRTETSILLITHDFGLVSEYADRVLVMYEGKIVEAADVFTLFRNPVHPYTKGLMNSIPRIEDPRVMLQTVRDMAVQEGTFEGRVFAPEVFSKDGVTYHAPSALIEVEKGHFVRFFTNKMEVSRT